MIQQPEESADRASVCSTPTRTGFSERLRSWRLREGLAALTNLPTAQQPTRLFLLVRYADCLAGAGDRDAAVQAVTPAVGAASTSNRAGVEHESSSLEAAFDSRPVISPGTSMSW
ncbi:hypothetical protein [Kribbella sp. CA-293567]|uniref:hypothetical protein n=1 Tax=Kribbella sp. CA-293567 TaxID=3002436 RepID=UPI0022DE0710|nr:hypothetical protein [Kribbella sp. CA-293567]WBQ03405.1 hypothetical protein OX958_25945 [Kribbella sp. CA-293567]